MTCKPKKVLIIGPAPVEEEITRLTESVKTDKRGREDTFANHGAL